MRQTKEEKARQEAREIGQIAEREVRLRCGSSWKFIEVCVPREVYSRLRYADPCWISQGWPQRVCASGYVFRMSQTDEVVLIAKRQGADKRSALPIGKFKEWSCLRSCPSPRRKTRPKKKSG